MQDSDIEVVKQIEKDILAKLLEVCEINNLKVYVDGGTLLGAAREQHFIEYDDDIDVAMHRKDYDQLMKIGPEYFHEPYFFQSAYTDDGYYREHIQIRRSDTCGAIDFELHNVKFNQGIFIDVFPYDGVPADGLAGRWQWFQIKYYKKLMSMLYSPIKPHNILKRILKTILHPLSFIIKREKCYKCFEKICSRYSSKSDIITLLSFNKSYRMRLLNKNWYDNTVFLPFDEMLVPCPGEYEKVLTSKYGDWKTPVNTGNEHQGIIFSANRSYLDVQKEKKD